MQDGIIARAAADSKRGNGRILPYTTWGPAKRTKRARLATRTQGTNLYSYLCSCQMSLSVDSGAYIKPIKGYVLDQAVDDFIGLLLNLALEQISMPASSI